MNNEQIEVFHTYFVYNKYIGHSFVNQITRIVLWQSETSKIIWPWNGNIGWLNHLTWFILESSRKPSFDISFKSTAYKVVLFLPSFSISSISLSALLLFEFEFSVALFANLYGTIVETNESNSIIINDYGWICKNWSKRQLITHYKFIYSLNHIAKLHW